MNEIYEFCKDSEKIMTSTEEVICLKNLSVGIDFNKDEIYRSRHSVNKDCIFNFSLGITDNINKKEVEYMKTIEMFYPDIFSWRFNGQNIEALGRVELKHETLGIIGRFKGFNGFITRMRDRLIEILKYRDFVVTNETLIVKDMIISTGSLNAKTGLYVVDIKPTYSFIDILTASKNRIITDINIKTFNMKYWVHEINPDFMKPQPKNIKTYKATPDMFDKYPPCIKEISKLKKKGNRGRYLLGTFLLGIHYERDAKHQLDIMLSDGERNHMNKGNCKDQWRTIVAKEYPPPSCKVMVEEGWCKQDCGRPAPIVLEVDKNELEK